LYSFFTFLEGNHQYFDKLADFGFRSQNYT